MSAGIVFAEETITSSYSLEIQQSTEQTWSKDASVTFDFSCSDLPEGETGVGLWQWVTTSSDGVSSVFL